MSGFPMGRRRFLAAAAGAATLASVPLRARAGGTKPSGPASTQPEFLGEVPSPADVLGFALGVDREVTSAEADRYLRAVGLASPRVHVDQLGTSVRGRPIRYAIVGRPEHVTQEGLAAIRAAAATIRDPATPSEEVGALAETTPLILWVIANVHGSEESGADTSLQLLYELADRADEVVTTILDRAVVVLVPVQNPDGREADERRNAYGFDLNRDLFARTQPETDGRVELMRAYPPVLLLDEHEFGYYRSFFPPNNDPVYAEVTRQVLGWINEVYGEAMSARFVADGEDFFHGGVYDFFAAEFNDTVAANGFQAAGMTLEVYNGAPLDRRFARHSALAWTCLWAAARRGPRVWREQHRAFVEAVEQGRRGRLEPNERTFHPELRSRTTVPREPVRHYFLLDEPAKRWELQRLVRRLQRMDVRVYRLVAPLDVPDFTPYHEREHGRRLPAGTIWIPMAQPQKHWIQMLLHEHPYPPTNYTFGLAGWSNPLCMNLSGGRSGSVLHPVAEPLAEVPEPPAPALPEAVPSIGLYQMSFGSYADESCGSTRWTFERLWGLTFHEVRNEDLAAGNLDGIDVLVAPGGDFPTALRKLGDAGGRTLVDWVNAGGRYVGYRGGGAKLAAALGITTAVLRDTRAYVPGTPLRVAVDPASPLAEGVGRWVWVLFDSDDAVVAPGLGSTPLTFPTARAGGIASAGIAIDLDALEGTAAAVDELVGAGRVVLFPSDPTFQGEVEGFAKVLRNAVLGPDPDGLSAGTRRGEVRAPAAGSAERRAAERAAREAVLGRPEGPGAFRLVVRASDAPGAAAILRRVGFDYREHRGGPRTRFVLANPRQLAFEEHPAGIELLVELRRAGIEIEGFSAR